MNQAKGWMRGLLREPLLRFMLVGVALFAADHFLGGSGSSNQGRIVVTATQQAVLREAFRAERGREPSNTELQSRLDRWIDEQVLYREALALGLDRKDAIVRRQLTQKMRFLIEDATMPAEPSLAELQSWLEKHPERYGQPSTISFQQVFLGRGRHGADLARDAQRIAVQLAKQPEDFVGLGDPFLVGQVITQMDETRTRNDFGAGFAEELRSLPVGQWSQPLASSFGLHVVRITERGAFRPVRLDEVADRVRVDYRLAQREQLNQEALAKLRAQYQIEIEGHAKAGDTG